MQTFKCPICGGRTERIWESATQTRIAMRCVNGHEIVSKSGVQKQYPVILVSSEELV